jgi:two-component system, response regulator PdtaR
MNALSVVVVEDEIIISMLLSELLVAMGHNVCAVAATETDAVAAAARCRPDLMIVDERLRIGSGIAAVEQILRSGLVPHIFVSGDPLTDRSINSIAVMMRKPFVVSDLIRAIQRALGNVAAAVSKTDT